MQASVPAVTIDLNCVIELEEERPNAPHVRHLLKLDQEGVIRLRVPAIGASERKPDGTYASNFSEFRAKLAAVGLDSAELLRPPLILGMAFLDWCVVSGPAIDLPMRQLHAVLFPNMPYEYADYRAAVGIGPGDAIDPKWRNARCDVLAVWSHIHYGGDVFVTSDGNFHKKTRKAALIELGARNIVRPAEFVGPLRA